MDHRTAPPSFETPAPNTSEESSVETPFASTTHPVLSRLLEEVRNKLAVEATYDRVHNRHNRGR